MARLYGEMAVQLGIGKYAGPAGVRPARRCCFQSVIAGVLSALTAGLMAIVLAPASAADHTTELRSAIAAARGACPPLQADAVLDSLALRANSEMQSYAQHTARFIPFETPQLLPILREMDYAAGKAKLLVGYGDSVPRRSAPPTREGKAILGVVTEGYEFIPDCTYTKFGASAIENRSEGYVLAVSVLAG